MIGKEGGYWAKNKNAHYKGSSATRGRLQSLRKIGNVVTLDEKGDVESRRYYNEQ
jgi:hypothetical protein